MPIYTFQCKNNHLTEELYLVISEAPTTIKCTHCKAKAKRIMSPGVGFVFNQPGGTYSGAKREAEVKQAMQDYSSGKGKKNDES